MRLTDTQRDALLAWWEWRRGRTFGYYPEELQEPKGTLDALHRRGLVERPHVGIGTWCARITPVGRALAATLVGAEPGGET